jgi:hypothetical protein
MLKIKDGQAVLRIEFIAEASDFVAATAMAISDAWEGVDYDASAGDAPRVSRAAVEAALRSLLQERGAQVYEFGLEIVQSQSQVRGRVLEESAMEQARSLFPEAF